MIQEYFNSIDGCSGQGPDSRPPRTPPPRSNGSLTPIDDVRPETSHNELKTELAVIFKKIGDKKMTQNGMECLYQFQQDHPEVDVKPFLNNTSAAFRSYIENGLRIIHEKLKKPEPDPMDIDDDAVEHIEDTPITWKESPDGRYLPADTEARPREQQQQPSKYHQPVNT